LATGGDRSLGFSPAAVSGAPLAKPVPVPGVPGSATTPPPPTNWSLGIGPLPTAAGHFWNLLMGIGALVKGKMTDLTCDYAVVVGPYAVFERGGDIGLAQLLKDGGGDEQEIDARVLAIIEDDGRRHRNFRESVRDMSETDWPGWPVLGPRTTRWVLRFIAEHDIAPRARHTKWRHEAGLSPSDPYVDDHDLALRVIQMAVEFDQLNITELASFELLARRAQMAEWRHRDRLISRNSIEDGLEDDYLYMGTAETRGLILMAPDLADHVTGELHKEANILKERRKVKEERRTSRASDKSGGGNAGGSGGGDGGGKPKHEKELQSKVDKQASEIKKLQEALAKK
jgi:hypothetical protein